MALRIQKKAFKILDIFSASPRLCGKKVLPDFLHREVVICINADIRGNV